MTCLFKGPCLPMEDGMEQPGTNKTNKRLRQLHQLTNVDENSSQKNVDEQYSLLFFIYFFSLSPTPYVVCLSGSRVFDGDGKLPHPLYPKCLFWCTCAYGFETRGQHQDETESRDIAQYTLSTEQKLPHLFYQRNGFYF